MKLLSLIQRSSNYLKLTFTISKLHTLITIAAMVLSLFGRTPHAIAATESIQNGNDVTSSPRSGQNPPEWVEPGTTLIDRAIPLSDVAALPPARVRPLPEMAPLPPPAPVSRPTVPTARPSFVRAASPAAVRTQSVAAPRAAIKAIDGKGYPWAQVAFPNSSPDNWGMFKRQCVSYTAWKVANSGRHMPYWGGRGSAYLWDDNARAAGIPVDTNPRVGDVAVKNVGIGHVMYVEAVHGDNTITVSDYNNAGSGTYSEYRRAAAGLTYIHF